MTSRREALAVLRRRLEHLEQRIATNDGTYRGMSYVKAEVAAIRLALRELGRERETVHHDAH